MAKSITVLVAYHRDFPVIENDVFTPIQVGRVRAATRLPMIGDDTGDNISEMNVYYCELSATYWAWKNVASDYVGICHYRRYFAFRGEGAGSYVNTRLRYFAEKAVGNIVRPGINTNIDCVLDTADLRVFKDAALDFSARIGSAVEDRGADIVALKPTYFSCRDVYSYFCYLGYGYLDTLGKAIREAAPDYYDSYLSVSRGNRISCRNMVIMRKDLYGEYCSFLFGVLRLVDAVYLDGRDGVCASYARIGGYLGEILTYVFLVKKAGERANILLTNSVCLVEEPSP